MTILHRHTDVLDNTSVHMNTRFIRPLSRNSGKMYQLWSYTTGDKFSNTDKFLKKNYFTP